MSTFSKTHVAKATISPEGRIVSCDESFARLLMHCRRKVDEYKLRFFIVNEDWSRMEKMLQMGKTRREGEFSLLVGEDKCSILLHFVAHPLQDKNFRIDVEALSNHGSATLQDADQLREVGLLREAIRSRDDFLSVAVHELKTPLTSICLQVDGVLRARASKSNREIPEWLYSRILIVQRQCRRLAHLMNELLDISRIQAGRFDIIQEEIDLGSLVKDIVEQFHYEASVAGCTLSMHISPQVIGRWDRRRLDQLVTNLLSNAVKYGAGKPIEISVGEANNWGWLKVRDYGIGIPREKQEKIFQRFERILPTRHYRGLGLGLWISSQIVRRLGGRIFVESESGNGACFIVELPCHEYADDSFCKAKNLSPGCYQID